MQATTTVRSDAPANEGYFKDAFFQRFSLRDRPLDLGDGVEKSYPFPTLYHDVGCAIGIFMCDFGAARALLPDRRLEPVRMPGGRSLVIFSSYEYRQVLKVWPYNEIAMTIPVMAAARVRPPALPMLLPALFPKFGYHVFHMPVTSRENTIRGRKLWGLPKVTQPIDVDLVGGDSHTTAREEDGTPYFQLRVPTVGSKADFDVKGWLYSSLDGKIVKSQTCFKGTFNVQKHMRVLWKKGLTPDRETLTLGPGPSAKPLIDLGIEAHPFQTRWTPSMNAAFDLPIDGWQL